MIRFKPIQTDCLVLRQFVSEDASKLLAMSQEPGIRKWIPDQVYQDEPAALAVLRYLIVQYQGSGAPVHAPYVLGIYLKDSSELIGHVGLSPVEVQVEVGYAIEEKYQGKGYASQAVSAMCVWGMQRFDLSHVLGIVAGDNVASCKVLLHSGFTIASECSGVIHGWRGIIKTYQKKQTA